jgi:NAD(P)-dependent dehydrogenase (short-subunit alcohol dehydrogenase family)
MALECWANGTGRGQAGPYAASKHALKALSDNFREEVNIAGLRVLSTARNKYAAGLT